MILHYKQVELGREVGCSHAVAGVVHRHGDCLDAALLAAGAFFHVASLSSSHMASDLTEVTQQDLKSGLLTSNATIFLVAHLHSPRLPTHPRPRGTHHFTNPKIVPGRGLL